MSHEPIYKSKKDVFDTSRAGLKPEVWLKKIARFHEKIRVPSWADAVGTVKRDLFESSVYRRTYWPMKLSHGWPDGLYFKDTWRPVGEVDFPLHNYWYAFVYMKGCFYGSHYAHRYQQFKGRKVLYEIWFVHPNELKKIVCEKDFREGSR